MCKLQLAYTAVAGGKAWPGSVVATLVRAGLSSLQLAHAESAAQEALASAPFGAAQPDPCKPRTTRSTAARVLQDAAVGMTQPVARILAKQGLVKPLLEASTHATFLSWKARSCQPAYTLLIVLSAVTICCFARLYAE
jgi:hypothetical protein